MSTNEIRKWLNLVESKSTLNEYAGGKRGGGGGGDGGPTYYQATKDFIKHYENDRKNDENADSWLDSDIKWLESVADAFLIGEKQGIEAFFRIDTMLQEELADWYKFHGLNIQSYLDQRYPSGQPGWLINFGGFNEDVFVNIFKKCIEDKGKRIIREFTVSHNSDKKLANWWLEGFVIIMNRAAPIFAKKIEQAMTTNPDAFESEDTFDDEIGQELIGSVYYTSKLRQEFDQKDFTLSDDVSLSVPRSGSKCLWWAYRSAIK